jgi:3-oxoacyl-[acyl-carrier-protein] synthase II
MHRIFEKGPRLASPAEFPNLVPSAPVGHVSIYAGLHGPAFGTADLAASGECAVAQAWQLVAAGEAPRVVAGSAEPRSVIAERVLSALFDDGAARAGRPRGDAAAAVVLESEAHARARSATVIARVERVVEWRLDDPAPLEALRRPLGSRAEVVLARVGDAADRVVARTRWAECPRIVCANFLLETDALGAVAVAVAAGRIGAGRIAEALVLGVAQRRGYAILLVGP